MISWSPGLTLALVEKEVILAALKFFGGNKTRTASALGISVRTVDYKLEEYQKADEERLQAEEAAEKARLSKKENPYATVSESPQARLPVEPNARVSEKQSVPMRKRA